MFPPNHYKGVIAYYMLKSVKEIRGGTLSGLLRDLSNGNLFKKRTKIVATRHDFWARNVP